MIQEGYPECSTWAGIILHTSVLVLLLQFENEKDGGRKQVVRSFVVPGDLVDLKSISMMNRMCAKMKEKGRAAQALNRTSN